MIARAGKFKGVAVLQTEQDKGLALMRVPRPTRSAAKAIIKVSKTGNDNVGEAFKDNVVLDYAGLPASELTAAQKKQLLDLVGEYVANMDDGHARVKMDEVRAAPGPRRGSPGSAAPRRTASSTTGSTAR